MKHLKSYKIFESKSIKFKKKPNKKGAKTETYDVIKDGETIGQIKWSSRMRGYAFLPEKEHDDEIKNFIKDLMSKRKSKLIKEDVEIDDVEIDEHIRILKDMSLDIVDKDLSVNVKYLKKIGNPPALYPGFWVDITKVKENSFGALVKLYEFRFNDVNDSLFSIIDYLESEGFKLSKVEFYPSSETDKGSKSCHYGYIKDNKLYSHRLYNSSSDIDVSDMEILALKLNFK